MHILPSQTCTLLTVKVAFRCTKQSRLNVTVTYCICKCVFKQSLSSASSGDLKCHSGKSLFIDKTLDHRGALHEAPL